MYSYLSRRSKCTKHVADNDFELNVKQGTLIFLCQSLQSLILYRHVIVRSRRLFTDRIASCKYSKVNILMVLTPTQKWVKAPKCVCTLRSRRRCRRRCSFIHFLFDVVGLAQICIFLLRRCDDEDEYSDFTPWFILLGVQQCLFRINHQRYWSLGIREARRHASHENWEYFVSCASIWVIRVSRET